MNVAVYSKKAKQCDSLTSFYGHLQLHDRTSLQLMQFTWLEKQEKKNLRGGFLFKNFILLCLKLLPSRIFTLYNYLHWHRDVYIHVVFLSN